MRKLRPIFYDQMSLLNLILSITMLTGIIWFPSVFGHVLFWVSAIGIWIVTIIVVVRSKR